jgi:hypothetical protein
VPRSGAHRGRLTRMLHGKAAPARMRPRARPDNRRSDNRNERAHRPTNRQRRHGTGTQSAWLASGKKVSRPTGKDKSFAELVDGQSSKATAAEARVATNRSRCGHLLQSSLGLDFRESVRRFGGFSPRRLNSFKTVGGISRHPHALACATCHSTRWLSVEPMGIGCRSCHLALITMGLLLAAS